MNLDRIKDNIKINENGCWLWQKSCNKNGYGQLTENKKYWSAHRYALSCVTSVSEKDIVRHICHNPKCCNPEHLEIGTKQDNWYDSENKHREAGKRRRKRWYVEGITYNTVREVVEKTGLSMSSVIKYTINGVFKTDDYRKGCYKAGVTPKI